MTDTKAIIGQRIHALRISLKLTQAQFSELIDISVNFLSEIENGKKGMSQETLYRLCSKFSVSSDYILFGTEQDAGAVTASNIVEYANKLNLEELETLSDYLLSLINLRRNIKQ